MTVYNIIRFIKKQPQILIISAIFVSNYLGIESHLILFALATTSSSTSSSTSSTSTLFYKTETRPTTKHTHESKPTTAFTMETRIKDLKNVK